MILFNIDSFDDSCFSEDINKALTELRKLDFSLKPGDYNIFRDSIVLKIAETHTEPRASRKFECHRKFIDIHFLLEGRQIIEWASLNHFSEPQNYDSENDICFFGDNPGSTQKVLLDSSFRNAVIFFPEDCHKPLCAWNFPEKIKTCVVKIRK